MPQHRSSVSGNRGRLTNACRFIVKQVVSVAISAAIGAIASFIYLRVNTPPVVVGAFANLSGNVPVVTRSTPIKFTLENLPSGWKPFVLVSTGPNTVYPERLGQRCTGITPIHCADNNMYYVRGVTVGNSRGEIFLVAADPLASYAFITYLDTQNKLQKTFAWRQGLSISWLSSNYVHILQTHVVRP
jgi:hypothetical protein